MLGGNDTDSNAESLPLTPAASAKRRQRPSIRPVHDIALLKEAIAIFPYGKPRAAKAEAWMQMACNANTAVGADIFDERRARERCKTLVEAHRADDLLSLRASGTNEEYSEREQLLTDLTEMIDTGDLTRAADAERRAREEAQGEQLRLEALEGLSAHRQGSRSASVSVDGSDAPRQRARRDTGEWDIEAWLKEDAASRKEAYDRRFAMEQQRIAVDHRRFLKYSSTDGGSTKKELSAQLLYKQEWMLSINAQN
ncbi:uncharacterized protein EV422DRAFT_622898 [Fimicolochytrium jonesii]|uniref:uncharacterized protein n=1 Tax=Fimicolochytrium jonesii TaxID=1396493 RepID=UPI0022FF1D8C|nr:uncharacterized protein EV422DRAFT_622898 [Fimicolochytrium jonesii]KAI8817014.1 hypothetical protein EV422DRAFT_622898 [Fimicolochytrium jonesii]